MLAVNLDLRNKTVLLVGGGSVGRRKLSTIIRAGAFVRVVEPEPNRYLTELAENKSIDLAAEFRPEFLDGVSLVFVATSDSGLNQKVARAARARGIWVNRADQPEEGDFFLPAVIERGLFRLAVSTGGHSPALAAVAAERLRKVFGPEYGRLLALMSALRPSVLASGLGGEERKAVFRSLAESETLLQLMAGGDGQAQLDCIKNLLPPDLIDEQRLERAIYEAAVAADNRGD